MDLPAPGRPGALLPHRHSGRGNRARPHLGAECQADERTLRTLPPAEWSPVIIGLFPELTSAGGVQRAGRLTAAAIASFAEHRGESWHFLSLNDPQSSSPFTVGAQQIAFSGFGRSKSNFLRAAWAAARPQPSLIFALHPNLAPVVAA